MARQSGSGHLFRALGLTFGIAVTVGGTIGVGILRAPGKVAAAAGSAWLTIGLWLLGGVYIMASALTIAEVAAMLPKAGGFYVYAREAFGDAVGFAAGWSDWLTQCASMAYLALSVGDFSITLLGSRASPGWAPPIGAGAIVLLTLLQLRGLRASSRTQQVTSAVQAGGFLLLVAACFAWGGPRAAAIGVPVRGHWGVGVVLSMRAILGTYDGWYSAIYFAEEDRDPGRNIPRSMIGGVLAIVAVYILLNLAFLHVLGLPGMARSDFPASDAAQSIFGPRGSRVITILSLLSLPAVINAGLLCASRILFAMSRDGLFWRKGADVNRRGTPATSLLIGALAGIAMLFTGTFDALLGVTGILTVLTYCCALVSLFVLRRTRPGLERPFRAPGYPWLPLAVIAGGFVFLVAAVGSDRTSTLIAFALVGCSFPAYRLCKSSP
ncbi:MAG: APC family permease [Bryobacteraceae bacterium]